MKTQMGFTLIELLVVLAVIGVLASIAFVATRTATERARNARRVSDLKSIFDQLYLYADTHKGEYPLSRASHSSISLPGGIDTVNATSDVYVCPCNTGYHGWSELSTAMNTTLPVDPLNKTINRFENFYYVYSIYVDSAGNPKTVYWDQGSGSTSVCGVTTSNGPNRIPIAGYIWLPTGMSSNFGNMTQICKSTGAYGPNFVMYLLPPLN